MKTSVISLIFPLISAFGNDNGGYRQAQNLSTSSVVGMIQDLVGYRLALVTRALVSGWLPVITGSIISVSNWLPVTTGYQIS